MYPPGYNKLSPFNSHSDISDYYWRLEREDIYGDKYNGQSDWDLQRYNSPYTVAKINKLICKINKRNINENGIDIEDLLRKF